MDDNTKREIERLLLEQVELDKQAKMKDGNELVQQMRAKAKERDRRYMEYLLECPEWQISCELLMPYRLDILGKALNWN